MKAQTRNKLYWALSCLGTLLCVVIAVAFLSYLPTSRHPRLLSVFGFTLILSVEGIGYHYRRNQDFLERASRSYLANRLLFSMRLRMDFLLREFFITGLVVYGPLVLAFLLAMKSRHSWIRQSEPDFQKISDTIKQLATLAGALLAAQIAIFNFLFGQILGKFSSYLAVAVSRHRTIRLLRTYSIILLAILYFSYFYGAPHHIQTIETLIVVSLLSAFSLTVWVSNIGIQIDKAVLYAGQHGATQVNRFASKPVEFSSSFWSAMMTMGLDWRAPERLGGILVPVKMAESAQASLTSLFNAAHKCIQENQQETLIASLQAISRVVIAYAEKRSDYSGQTDSGLGFLNDQFAGLLRAAETNKNEYLISHVVLYIGFCSKAIIRIGHRESGDIQTRRLSTPNFVSWCALLGEAFDLGKKLKRSTAAPDAIHQLSELGGSAILLKFYDNVQYSYISELKRIFGECIKEGSFYHFGLCGDVTASLTRSWLLAAGPEASFHLAKPLAILIKECAVFFSKVTSVSSMNLNDPITVLTTHVSSRTTLQDICAAYCTQNPTKSWEISALTKGFKEVKGVICDLLEDALARDIFSASSYCDAYFEIALLVSLGDRKIGGEAPRRAAVSFREAWLLSLIKRLDQMIAAALRSTMRRSEMTAELSAVLGLAIVCAREMNSSPLKQECERIIKALSGHIQVATGGERTGHQVEISYLQLFGAWALLLGSDEIATSIASALEPLQHRPRNDFYSFGGGPWSARGYPEAGDLMRGDYSLPYPRNLNEILAEGGRRRLAGWNELLTGNKTLESFLGLIKAATP